MSASTQQRRIVIVAYEGFQSLDVTGPLEVFSTAQQILAAQRSPAGGYQVSIVSREGVPLRSSSGLLVTPERTLDSLREPIDTLLVPGGEGRTRAVDDGELLAWIARAHAHARRTVSVCTGAFLLARAGLLDGRRATTHWAWASELQQAHPQVRVDAEPIFIRDGSIWTSAGVTAGMDLALALVEEDHERELALKIARALVMFVRRPGGRRSSARRWWPSSRGARRCASSSARCSRTWRAITASSRWLCART